jgi:hypothetical protein
MAEKSNNTANEVTEKADKLSLEEVEIVNDSNKDTFETLYASERRKSQMLLISTATFAALFLISLAFGLRVAGHDSYRHDTVQPGGMMRGDYGDLRGPGSQYYR